MKYMLIILSFILLAGCQKLVKYELVSYESIPTVVFPRGERVKRGFIEVLGTTKRYDIVWRMDCNGFDSIILKLGKPNHPCKYQDPSEYIFTEGEYAGVIRTTKGKVLLHFSVINGELVNHDQ